MTKLKLGSIEDDKPVKLTIELPAAVHRNLVAYAEAIGREGGQAAPDPAKLIAPMIERFMATDRAFGKARRNRSRSIECLTRVSHSTCSHFHSCQRSAPGRSRERRRIQITEPGKWRPVEEHVDPPRSR